MSAMKNVAIAMDEVLEILSALPTNQREYLVNALPEAEAQRRALDLGIDVPSCETAVDWMSEYFERTTAVLPI